MAQASGAGTYCNRSWMQRSGMAAHPGDVQSQRRSSHGSVSGARAELPVVVSRLQQWLARKDEGSRTLHPPHAGMARNPITTSRPIPPFLSHIKHAAGGDRDAHIAVPRILHAKLVFLTTCFRDWTPMAALMRTRMLTIPDGDTAGETARARVLYRDGTNDYTMALSIPDRPHFFTARHPTPARYLVALAQAQV